MATRTAPVSGPDMDWRCLAQVELGQWEDRTSLDVVQSDPFDKTSYYSTSGAGTVLPVLAYLKHVASRTMGRELSETARRG
eukprot:2381174-Rhodomonas_salina.1